MLLALLYSPSASCSISHLNFTTYGAFYDTKLAEYVLSDSDDLSQLESYNHALNSEFP